MRILLLEDNPADAELIEHELRGESLPLFILKRVETEKDFIKELTGNPPDLILSDYDLPCYDGASALREAKARCPDTPFILVTGAISEDRAIETLTQGAKDYVLKGRLSRLVPAIKRVLLEADEHKARRKAEQEVLAASLYARSLIEASLDPMITIDTEGKVIDVNAATEVVTGVPRCQLIGDDFSKCFENPKSALACYEQALSKGSARDYPLRIRHSSGGLTEVLCNAATYLDIEGKIEGVFVAARDCTALRQADEALRKAHADLEEKVKTKRARLEAETRERERIERHLIDRDEKLSIALESAGQGVWELEIENERLLWSIESKSLFGLGPDAVVSRELFYELLHPEDRERIRQSVNAAIKNHARYDEEARFIGSEGKYRWLATTGRVFYDEEDKAVRILGIMRDITERKEIEEALKQSEKRYRDLIKYAPIGIYDVDFRQNKFTSVNDVICKLTGYSREELLEMNPVDMLETGSKKTAMERIQAWMTGTKPAGSMEYEVKAKNGRKYHIVVNSIFASDEHGRPTGITGIAHNMTERKRAEEELKETAERLTSANEALESFSHSVSHDLQAPLRAITGFAHMILKESAPEMKAETRRKFQAIRENAERMQRLIGDLLDLSKIGRHTMSCEQINMDKLIEEIWKELANACPGKNLLLKNHGSPPAFGDRVLIRQVLTNLLASAVKYSRHTDPIEVESGGYSQNGDPVYYIKDNGVGFEMKYYDKLFAAFQRLHSASEFEGTGLGLSIAQRIIHNHEGRIWAESTVGRGATFYFTLPGKTP